MSNLYELIFHSKTIKVCTSIGLVVGLYWGYKQYKINQKMQTIKFPNWFDILSFIMLSILFGFKTGLIFKILFHSK
jgi:hypothetical protein